ncbi:MAG: class I SAM-dependent methyltransferase [Gaiellales bacterium]
MTQQVIDRTGLDLGAVKRRQQATWASGNYAAVGSRIASVAEQLADSADLRAGSLVLDVATGNGNAAIAAARRGCDVVGIDYVPGLLEHGRKRVEIEGLDVALLEGDAEELQFPDASFDVVTSVFGVMFAPDQQRAASELVRVCRPGGTIALASWTPDGYIGEFFRTTAGFASPPAGLASPFRWGTDDGLRELLGDGIAMLDVHERTYTFRFRSAEEFVEFFRTWYGPTLKAFESLDEAGRAGLEQALVELARRHNRHGEDALAVDAAYIEAIAIRS